MTAGADGIGKSSEKPIGVAGVAVLSVTGNGWIGVFAAMLVGTKVPDPDGIKRVAAVGGCVGDSREAAG